MPRLSDTRARVFCIGAALAATIGVFTPADAAQPVQGASAADYTTAHVSAPYAERLVVATKREHREIQKIGLHVTLPPHGDHVIIASDIPSKIGKRSSPADMTVVTSGKPSAVRQDKGSFWDMALPIADAKGGDIGGGLLILEIPFAYAQTQAEALQKATAIRDELQRQIPDTEALFKS
jgi:hypothetical protein